MDWIVDDDTTDDVNDNKTTMLAESACCRRHSSTRFHDQAAAINDTSVNYTTSVYDDGSFHNSKSKRQIFSYDYYTGQLIGMVVGNQQPTTWWH